MLNTSPVLVVLAIQTLSISFSNEISTVAFTQLDPLLVSWWRMAFAVVIMLIWRRPFSAEKRKKLPRDLKTWIIFAGLGVAVVGMSGVFYIAIDTLNSGVATAIEFIGPLSVAVFTGRTWREYLGAFLAFVGLLTLAGSSLFSLGPSSIPGLIAICASGALWATYIVLGRMVAHGSSGLDNLTVSLTLGWIIQTCLIGYPAVTQVFHPTARATWAHENGGIIKLLIILLIISVCSSIISYVLDQVLMRRVSANRFSVMQALLPVVNLLVTLLFGARPGVFDFLGVGIIVLAVMISFSSDADPLPTHELTSRKHTTMTNEEGKTEEVNVID